MNKATEEIAETINQAQEEAKAKQEVFKLERMDEMRDVKTFKKQKEKEEEKEEAKEEQKKEQQQKKEWFHVPRNLRKPNPE